MKIGDLTLPQQMRWAAAILEQATRRLTPNTPDTELRTWNPRALRASAEAWEVKDQAATMMADLYNIGIPAEIEVTGNYRSTADALIAMGWRKS